MVRPDIFVISIAIPTDPPKLFKSTDDGGGYTITAYFVMHQETRDILKRVTSEGYDPKHDPEVVGDDNRNRSKVNAVRLWEEWCRRSPTDDSFCARFKVIPNAQNLKEMGLPSRISKYNGKPFLIKRPGETGFLYRHPDRSCIEFDISLHPFPYAAKKGINFMKGVYFKKALITFGFLIEGQAEDELPECLIGLMQLCYPDPVYAIRGEDFMAGTSPRSFD
jgi:Protein ENHANCED DISEASE RESISTANCE 2, C-terminal